MADSNFNYHGDVVVFDLDDTLMRERDYVRSGFRVIEAKLIQEGYPADGIAQKLTDLLNAREKYFDFLEEWLSQQNTPADMLPKVINLYRTHQPDSLPLADGAGVLLQELSRHGVILGLITDGRSITQRAKIRSLGIEKYFHPENIIISEESGSDKSLPNNFRHFVSAYPEARRFFYIGDNERKDFLMPNLLGWTTLRPKYHPDNVQEDFVNDDILSRPTRILTNLTDFLIEF